jgi:secreted Zn-dependent insulinase-like peptidase
LALKVANNLHIYPISKVNVASNYPINIDVSKVSELFKKLLDFSYVKIILCNSEPIKIKGIDSLIANQSTEPYYNLKYSKLDNPKVKDFIFGSSESKKFEFKIETYNPYLEINPKVKKDFKLIGKQSDEPKKLLIYLKSDKKEPDSDSKSNKNELWFGNSYEFNEAIIYSKLIFTNLDFINDLETFLFVKIFIGYLNYKLSTRFNLENELGFVTMLSFQSNNSIIQLSISGWNDKFGDFFKSVIDYIKSINFNSSDSMILNTLFHATDDEYTRISNNNPWEYSDYIFSLKSLENRYHYEEVIKFLGDDKKKKNLQSKFLKSFDKLRDMIINKSNFKFLLYGNTDINLLRRNIGFSDFYFKNTLKCVLNKSIQFSENIDMIHPNKDEINNCFSYYYYISKFSVSSISMLVLFHSSIQQKFYDSLRTKQQFGYLVKSLITKSNNDYYFVQKIQSERSIDEIKSAIDKFNKDFVQNFKEKGFDELKKSVHDDLKEPDNSTSETFSRYLNEISNNTYLFDRKDILADKVLSIKFTEFMFFLKKFLYDFKPQKLIIRKNENK